MFAKSMSRHRFLEIMSYLRFDLKPKRRKNVKEDKFFLGSTIWMPFTINCQQAFIPNVDITVDQQLMHCDACCNFKQCMPNKPDKFGIKFRMAVDAKSKYLLNTFLYLGKEDTRRNGLSVPTNVVIKLMTSLIKKGYNVTCNNCCTSLHLSVPHARICFYVYSIM